MRAIELHWDKDRLSFDEDGLLTTAIARAILDLKSPPVLLWNRCGAIRRIPLDVLRNALEIRDDYLRRNADRPHDLMHDVIGTINIDDLGPPMLNWQPITPK